MSNTEDYIMPEEPVTPGEFMQLYVNTLSEVFVSEDAKNLFMSQGRIALNLLERKSPDECFKQHPRMMLFILQGLMTALKEEQLARTSICMHRVLRETGVVNERKV